MPPAELHPARACRFPDPPSQDERQRIAALVKTMSAEIPILFVEHDIDRVFQIADHVTVMNEGHILVDGTVEVARNDAKVREVYIGSGAATVAATPRVSAAGSNALLTVDGKILAYPHVQTIAPQ